VPNRVTSLVFFFPHFLLQFIFLQPILEGCKSQLLLNFASYNVTLSTKSYDWLRSNSLWRWAVTEGTPACALGAVARSPRLQVFPGVCCTLCSEAGLTLGALGSWKLSEEGQCAEAKCQHVLHVTQKQRGSC
jgi:hypothetical protein